MKPLLLLALAGYGVSIPMPPPPVLYIPTGVSSTTPTVTCAEKSAVPFCVLPKPEGIVLEPFNTASPQTHTFFVPGPNHMHVHPVTWPPPPPPTPSPTPPLATPRDIISSSLPEYRRTPAVVTPHPPHSTSPNESSLVNNKLPTWLRPFENPIATPSAPTSTRSRKPKTRKPGHYLPTQLLPSRPLIAEDTVATPSAPAPSISRRTPAVVTPSAPASPRLHISTLDEPLVSTTQLPVVFSIVTPHAPSVVTPYVPGIGTPHAIVLATPRPHTSTAVSTEDEDWPIVPKPAPYPPAIVTPHVPTTTVESTEDEHWPVVPKPYPPALRPWPTNRHRVWHYVDPSLAHEGRQSAEATASAISTSTVQRRTSHLNQESQHNDTESSNDQMRRRAERVDITSDAPEDRVDITPDAREENFDQDLDWFETNHWFSRLAQEEETPSGYDQVVSDYNASAARQPVSSFALPDYDAQTCSQHCDQDKRCQSFGHYIERQPSCTDCEEGTTVETVNMCELYNTRLSPRVITNGNSDWNLPGMKFTRAVRAFNGYNRALEPVEVETLTVTVQPSRPTTRVTVTRTGPAFPTPTTIIIISTTTETLVSLATTPVTIEETSNLTLPPETSTIQLASPVFITVTQAPSTTTQTETQTETSTESYTVLSTTTESSTSTETDTLTSTESFTTTETATESSTVTETTTESSTITQTATTSLIATLTATTTVPLTQEDTFTWLAEGSGAPLRPNYFSDTDSDSD